MRFAVYEEMQDGFRTMVLADCDFDSLAVVVPEIGCNMIRCRLQGRETIAGPPGPAALPARSAEFGVPLLCPPGRIPGGSFVYRGRAYRFPVNDGAYHLHGQVRELPWRIVDAGGDSRQGAFLTAELKFAEEPRLFAHYPHRIALRLTYRLRGARLSGELAATNEGDDEAPFGFGLHPYFALRGKARIAAPVALQYDNAAPGGLIKEKPGFTRLCAELSAGMPLDRLPADVDHFVFKADGADERICRVISEDDSGELQFQYDGNFPFLVVFKPPWADAVSLEPWSCISDSWNTPLAAEWSGAGGLKPGERRSYRWSWQTGTVAIPENSRKRRE